MIGKGKGIDLVKNSSEAISKYIQIHFQACDQSIKKEKKNSENKIVLVIRHSFEPHYVTKWISEISIKHG
jgi:hypothetical protein